MQNFWALGALLPDLQPSAPGGLAPGPLMAFGGFASKLPKQLPPLQIFGYKRLNVVWIWSANKEAEKSGHFK